MIGRIESSSPSASVICEEVFDEEYQPSKEEINDYATKLGIDPEKEPQLLYLAKEGLMRALPSDWKICYSEDQAAHYYYNVKKKHSQWDHPLDAEYRKLAERARQQLSSVLTPIVDSSDDVSQLDSGIRSLQGNEDLNSKISNNILSPKSNSINSISPSEMVSLREMNDLSGENNRCIESRTKYIPISKKFLNMKKCRFEVTKTNSHIGLAKEQQHLTFGIDEPDIKKSMSISGIDIDINSKENNGSLGLFAEVNNIGVKGILRDSSLTDMRRKGDSFEHDGVDEKKSVRFNLDDMKGESNESLNDDQMSHKILVQTPERNEHDKVRNHVSAMNVCPIPKSELTVLRAEQNSNNFNEKDNFNQCCSEDMSNENNSEPETQLKKKSFSETDPDSQNIPFDLDELDKKYEIDVDKLQNKIKAEVIRKVTNFPARSEICSPLIISEQMYKDARNEIQIYCQQKEADKIEITRQEKERMEKRLEHDIEILKKEHNLKLKNLRHDHDMRLTSVRHQLEEDFDKYFDEFRIKMEQDLEIKKKTVVCEHKKHMNKLQQNHLEILQDLERDLKSETEILKKENADKLSEMRDKLNHEMELERQRMRDTGADRLYEKIRCEKRLLEDKYRCLKEKYVRLKTDVRLSLERRNRRREQQAVFNQQNVNCTASSETECSVSNKPSTKNSENRSLSFNTSGGKPSLPPKTQLHNVKEHPFLEKSIRSEQSRMPGITSKYIKRLHIHDDTSFSQSDATISNNYPKGRYLPVSILSDNGNSDSEILQNNQENNNNTRGSGNKKQIIFSRLKSASTSRLNSNNFKSDRPCTPVENLRQQLQKLEDLEDQFPDNNTDATYHLRYPFSDISNEHTGTSSAELEFFKHRIHLERDSVRRAKESLRTQRTNFRVRQREIKQHHNTTRHSFDQLLQEEKELTEMEVNLHRTRALLGEKVIRLRNLEQSLQRIFEKEKPVDFLSVENKDEATMSDLSSHSSSGFSSTDFASIETQNLNRRKDVYHQETVECIQNLEILNVEIKEILDILIPSVPVSATPADFNWTNPFSSACAGSGVSNGAILLHAPQSIPTLSDRLETYRQLAAGRMGGAILAANTIVSQNPRAVNYTTSLVERTRDLRNWLRQAKNEHEVLTGTVTPTIKGAASKAKSSTNATHSVFDGNPQTNL